MALSRHPSTSKPVFLSSNPLKTVFSNSDTLILILRSSFSSTKKVSSISSSWRTTHWMTTFWTHQQSACLIKVAIVPNSKVFNTISMLLQSTLWMVSFSTSRCTSFMVLYLMGRKSPDSPMESLASSLRLFQKILNFQFTVWPTITTSTWERCSLSQRTYMNRPRNCWTLQNS